VSTAFLNASSVSTERSDDIAFLVGPRRDGIIKSNQLSPITLHDNTYQPLYIKDEEPHLTFQTDATLAIGTSVAPNQNNTRKRAKKISDARKETKRKELDFDFSDEGYPLALFHIGGEQMRQEYETNKRKRSPYLQLPDISTSNEEKKEVYTNNSNTYDFQEAEPQSTQSIQTHQIEVIMDTGATFSMLPGHFEFACTSFKPCMPSYNRRILQGGEHKRSNSDGRIPRSTHPRLKRGQKDHHPTSYIPPTQHGQFLPSSCHTVLDCGTSLHVYPTETKNIIQRGRYQDNERH
jgi:hypothetical protein